MKRKESPLKKPLCVITEPDWLPDGIQTKLENHFSLELGPYTDANLAEVLKHTAGAFIGLDHVLKGDLLPPNLQFIACPTTGLNHIDLEHAEHNKIQIFSLKGAVDFLQQITATSELCWGLILALSRKIPTSFDSVKAGEWDRDRFISNELQRKTIGIIGLGRLGKKIADYARAFDMTILACDPVQSNTPHVTWCTLQELLLQSDIVTLHADYTAENENMIDKKAFATMKNDAIFINTARGDLVEETALLNALNNKHIAGAALDVVRAEHHTDKTSYKALITYAQNHDNLIVTPHIGGVTYESQHKTAHFVVDNLIKWWEESKNA